MSDLEQLTVLDPARGRQPSDAEWARSRAMVDRVTAGRPARPMRRTLVVVAAAAAAGAVGAVTLPSLLHSTAETAYASWTPAPGSLTGAGHWCDAPSGGQLEWVTAVYRSASADGALRLR